MRTEEGDKRKRAARLNTHVCNRNLQDTDRPTHRPLIDVREMTDTLPDSIPIGSWKRQNWRSAEPKNTK